MTRSVARRKGPGPSALALGPLAANPAGELQVLGLDCHPLGVHGAQVRVLEQCDLSSAHCWVQVRCPPPNSERLRLGGTEHGAAVASHAAHYVRYLYVSMRYGTTKTVQRQETPLTWTESKGTYGTTYSDFETNHAKYAIPCAGTRTQREVTRNMAGTKAQMLAFGLQ